MDAERFRHSQSGRLVQAWQAGMLRQAGEASRGKLFFAGAILDTLEGA